MSDSPLSEQPDSAVPTPRLHRRRPRYSGKYPKKFEQKYKELGSQQNPGTIAKVLASGKTPAGTHRPIMVAEILEVLRPAPGELAVDCTLGYGGHAKELLARLMPGGSLIGLDQDPLELPRTESRLREAGYGPDVFRAVRTNFAGVSRALSEQNLAGVDLLLADLGVSSMQLDDPRRGFSFKLPGPLDLRMNPSRGEPASQRLARLTPDELGAILAENDEPFAAKLADALAGRNFATTVDLALAIRRALPKLHEEERETSVRRVFQALRILVNDEFSVLDALLRQIPNCLKPRGRAAILTFHSGEDRRVKHALSAGLYNGLYSKISEEPMRPTPEERRSNPRSSPAKLRWAIRAT